MRPETMLKRVAVRPGVLRASGRSVILRAIVLAGVFVCSVLSFEVARADCIVQDSSGLIRSVRLGAGTFRVSVELRGEAPETNQMLLHRVAGLSAVVTGRWNKPLLEFDGVAEGTWKLEIGPERIATVRIAAAPEISPTATPTVIPEG
jgi:hypothetical protein